MKKKHLLFAAAAMAMAGCANDTDLSSGNSTAQGDGSIAFNMTTPATTRGELDGQNAATKLNSTFFVWGEKNEGKENNTITSNVAAENTVFQNYTVSYNGNANSTTSNTKGWEYVGLASTVSSDNMTPKTPTTQTIKYWDANAADYTFTAVSAVSTDITSRNVKIEKKTAAPEGGTKYDKGYDITVKTMDAAANVYVADRVNITKGDLSTSNEKNKYGGYVNFTFRNFQSKVRFGIFENVPGYKVIITKIAGKTATTGGDDGSATSTDKEYTPTNKGFGVTVTSASIIEAGDNTKYHVTYEPKVGKNKTQQVAENTVKFTVDNSATKVDYLNTGGENWLSTKFTDWKATTTDNKFIGESATDATYDKTTGSGSDENAKAYTAILPNPQNESDMKLTISYTLISEDTGEKIEVKDKTVTVPHEYCQWKPNFAYTYLFKITDKSAELYPITFDAVVVENETGKQETITTVDVPSWTVFATDADGKAYKTITNEFAENDVIYATLLKSDGSIAELTTTNAQLYTVTTTDATNYPITEASVAHALSNTNVTTKKVTATPVTTKNFITYTNQVPTEDGNKITLSNSSKAMTWKAAANTVYAIEYTDGDTNTKTYKVIKIGGATGEVTQP